MPYHGEKKKRSCLPDNRRCAKDRQIKKGWLRFTTEVTVLKESRNFLISSWEPLSWVLLLLPQRWLLS